MRERFTAFRDRLLHPLAERRPPPREPGGERRPALVAGLGNPTEQYAQSRHNVAVWCLQLLASRHGTRLERDGRLERAEIEVEGHSLHLVWPRAMVNASGPPLAAELRRLGLRSDQLLLIFDDLDLPAGRLRIRPHGGHGGHNGVRSLADALGDGAFARLRIGIDRPYDDGVPVRDPERVAEWVLAPLDAAERALLEQAVARAADAIELAAVEGVDIAMNRFNRRD